MVQFRKRPGQERDAAAVQQGMLEHVRRGVDVGADYTTVRAQLRRLGKDTVRHAARAVGRRPPSDRTLRRWGRNDHIPHADLRTLLQRQDQVHAAGGVEAAAQRWGRSPKTVRDWLSTPSRDMRRDARQASAQTGTAARRSAAGIPVDAGGQPTRPATVVARGDVWVKGTSASATYEATRNVVKPLDMDTTNRVLAAREAGDERAALQAIEEYLSSNHAQCDEYGDDAGWHFDNLAQFDLSW